MSDDGTEVEYHIDPVVDGKPHFGFAPVGFAAILLLLAGVEIHQGNLLQGFNDIAFAGLILLYEKFRIMQWTSGYYVGFRSALEQTQDAVERMNEDEP